MEATTEEAATATTTTSYPNKDLIAKGKRTKRQRPNSPVSFTITPPLYNAAAALPPRSPTKFYAASASASAASSKESTTTEEADTARCLILLSRGHFIPTTNTRRNEVATTSYGGAATAAGGGACMYTCKTCNRSFHSFQALGGHRASHKKPKNEKKSAIVSDEEDFTSPSSSKSKFSLSLQLKSSPSPRIHECSYCGAEFASGQALGGHMRKHRGSGAAPIRRSPPNIRESIIAIDEAKAGNWLSLDLNLPAPEDEREKSFPPLLLNR